MTSLSRLMSENKLLSRLPVEERARLAPYLQTVNLRRGQQLVEFDYPIQNVYFLETAVTSTIVRTPHGETLEVGIMGAEGFVGLSLLTHPLHPRQAGGDGQTRAGRLFV